MRITNGALGKLLGYDRARKSSPRSVVTGNCRLWLVTGIIARPAVSHKGWLAGWGGHKLAHISESGNHPESVIG